MKSLWYGVKYVLDCLLTAACVVALSVGTLTILYDEVGVTVTLTEVVV